VALTSAAGGEKTRRESLGPIGRKRGGLGEILLDKIANIKKGSSKISRCLLWGGGVEGKEKKNAIVDTRGRKKKLGRTFKERKGSCTLPCCSGRPKRTYFAGCKAEGKKE